MQTLIIKQAPNGTKMVLWFPIFVVYVLYLIFFMTIFQLSLSLRIKQAVFVTVYLRLVYVNELCSDWLPCIVPHSKAALVEMRLITSG